MRLLQRACKVIQGQWAALQRQVKATHASWAQRHLDSRWMSEFIAIYHARVEHGLTVEQADAWFDALLTTRLSNTALAVRGLYDDTERAECRRGIHESFDVLITARRGT